MIRPLTGTVLIRVQAEGAGTLTIDNRTKTDVVVTMASASRPEVPIRGIYVRADEKATIGGIGTGVYMTTAAIDPAWDKAGRLRYDFGSSIRLGTFQFAQVISTEGVHCDKYEVRLSSSMATATAAGTE